MLPNALHIEPVIPKLNNLVNSNKINHININEHAIIIIHSTREKMYEVLKSTIKNYFVNTIIL